MGPVAESLDALGGECLESAAGRGGAGPGDPLEVKGRDQLGQGGVLQVVREVRGLEAGLYSGEEEAQGGQPLDGPALRLGDVFARPGGQVGLLGQAPEARADLGQAGGDRRHGSYLAVLQVEGVKQGPSSRIAARAALWRLMVWD